MLPSGAMATPQRDNRLHTSTRSKSYQFGDKSVQNWQEHDCSLIIPPNPKPQDNTR